jgi:hypothetical protein
VQRHVLEKEMKENEEVSCATDFLRCAADQQSFVSLSSAGSWASGAFVSSTDPIDY